MKDNSDSEVGKIVWEACDWCTYYRTDEGGCDFLDEVNSYGEGLLEINIPERRVSCVKFKKRKLPARTESFLEEIRNLDWEAIHMDVGDNDTSHLAEYCDPEKFKDPYFRAALKYVVEKEHGLLFYYSPEHNNADAFHPDPSDAGE